MKDTLCQYCKQVLIVNPDPEDQPICQKCIDAENARYTESRMSKFVWRVVGHKFMHRRINTGGFDPYSGDKWEIGKLSMNSTICFQVHLGKKFWNEDDFIGKLGIWLFNKLEEHRECEEARNCAEDSYHSFSYYE